MNKQVHGPDPDRDIALNLLLPRLFLCQQLWAGNLVQEEIPDACGLDPWDVGCSASEDAGLVFHRASNGTKAYNAMNLPAVTPNLA